MDPQQVSRSDSREVDGQQQGTEMETRLSYVLPTDAPTIKVLLESLKPQFDELKRLEGGLKERLKEQGVSESEIRLLGLLSTALSEALGNQILHDSLNYTGDEIKLLKEGRADQGGRERSPGAGTGQVEEHCSSHQCLYRP